MGWKTAYSASARIRRASAPSRPLSADQNSVANSRTWSIADTSGPASAQAGRSRSTISVMRSRALEFASGTPHCARTG